MLMDTIINFGDDLEEDILNRAYDAGKKSDLMLCLGTTLMVTPANSIVEMGKDPLRLVIVNRYVIKAISGICIYYVDQARSQGGAHPPMVQNGPQFWTYFPKKNQFLPKKHTKESTFSQKTRKKVHFLPKKHAKKSTISKRTC